MTMTLNIIVGLSAFILAGILFDRGRQLSWNTTKWLYMAMYLLKFLWAVGVLVTAFTGDAQAYQLLGVWGMLAWCQLTRPMWSCGPPERVLSQVGEFDSKPHAHYAQERHGRRRTDMVGLDIEVEG